MGGVTLVMDTDVGCLRYIKCVYTMNLVRVVLERDFWKPLMYK